MERQLPNGRLIKADADETDPRNAHLIHIYPAPPLKTVREQLTEWISTGAIVDLLLENITERGLPVTVDNAKKLWYAALEGLSDLVREVPDKRITEGPEIAEQDVENLKRALRRWYCADGKR